MEAQFIEAFLSALPEPEPWEVGEALAECLLEHSDDGEVVFPWNNRRDRRVPRASLPGADLVGFCSRDAAACLLIGEVKTSSDRKQPPSVMTGGSGISAAGRKRDASVELLGSAAVHEMNAN